MTVPQVVEKVRGLHNYNTLIRVLGYYGSKNEVWVENHIQERGY